MTLIIQSSYTIHLGDIIHFQEDHSEDEWRYLVTIKFTKPYHKKTFEVAIGSAVIRIKPKETILCGFGRIRPIKLRMFAILESMCVEVGECYIEEIPLTWEELKDKDEIQLLFIKEGRRDFLERVKQNIISPSEKGKKIDV